MPHQTQNITQYHAGDAMDITVTIEDETGSTVDITNASAEWLLKDEESQSDGNALLTKDTSSGGITITDAGDGELEISIETDDTQGLSGTKHHRLRLTDSDGDRVTVLHGDFEISL